MTGRPTRVLFACVRRIVPAGALLLCVTAAAGAQHVTIDAMGGSAYNVPTPLTVRQDGFDDIRITARYATRPLGPYAPYYAWRVSVWNSARDRAWEVQHVHHRLFLTNTTPEIQQFEVHYGYSYVLAGRAWRLRGFVLHADAGLLVTSPANTVRGRRLNTRDHSQRDVGYDVAGAGAALTISRAVRLSNHVGIVAEAALMAGRASVPVVDGSARVPNVSLHGRAGIQLAF